MPPQILNSNTGRPWSNDQQVYRATPTAAVPLSLARGSVAMSKRRRLRESPQGVLT